MYAGGVIFTLNPFLEWVHPFKTSSHAHLYSIWPPTQATTHLISFKNLPLLKFQMNSHTVCSLFCLASFSKRTVFRGFFLLWHVPMVWLPFFVEQDSWDGYTTVDFSLHPVMDIWFTSSFQLQEECTVIEEYTHAVTTWICSRDLMPSVGIIVNKSISYTWKLPRVDLSKRKKKKKVKYVMWGLTLWKQSSCNI